MKRICPIHGIYDKQNKQDKCPACAKVSNKHYDNNQRDQELVAFYKSPVWKKVRKIQLTKNPICVNCPTPAIIVDHIVEIRDGGSKLSLSNLQSMCISCHNIKTAEEKQNRGGRSKSLQTSSSSTDAPSNFSQSPFTRGTL